MFCLFVFNYFFLRGRGGSPISFQTWMIFSLSSPV